MIKTEITEHFEWHRIVGRTDVRIGDVGVHDVERRTVRTWRRVFAQRVADRVRPDPAISVPKRFALLEPHAMNHPVAHEPMVQPRIGRRDRIGADADIATVQFVRDGASHGEVRERFFHR